MIAGPGTTYRAANRIAGATCGAHSLVLRRDWPRGLANRPRRADMWLDTLTETRPAPIPLGRPAIIGRRAGETVSRRALAARTAAVTLCARWSVPSSIRGISCSMPVNNFTVIESRYGKFIVNRHCAHQAEYLIKTGRPHIQDEAQQYPGRGWAATGELRCRLTPARISAWWLSRSPRRCCLAVASCMRSRCSA